MKKIKFLNGFVILLIIIYIIQFLTNVYLIAYSPDFMNFSKEHELHFIFGHYTQFFGLAFSVVTFIGLFAVKRGLGIIIKQGFFNFKSGIHFKTAGILFLVSGFLSLVFNTILLFRSEQLVFVGEMGQGFLLMVIGFSLYIVSEILEDAHRIKQENDLTI